MTASAADSDALAFRAAEHGKPYAVVHGEPASVQFNVSDSGAHGLIAIAPAGRLGIDVEERSDKRDIDGLIETVFGPDERAVVAATTEAQRTETFYRLWTVKEALLKALGTGLYLDVTTFQAPAALLRGASGAEFRFPHLPDVAWWVAGREHRPLRRGGRPRDCRGLRRDHPKDPTPSARGGADRREQHQLGRGRRKRYDKSGQDLGGPRTSRRAPRAGGR